MRSRNWFSRLQPINRYILFLAAPGICGVIGFLAYIYLPLPEDLFSMSTGMSLKITDRYGTILRETLSVDGGRRTWLSYDEMPVLVIKAVLAAEDSRFFSHPGIDFFALLRAVFQNLRAGKIVSGGSTITQQLIKHRFEYPRTLPGKLKEMLMALRLEHSFSKETILTQYLNRVSFSNQVFGIESAAKLYFNKPAAHLSLAESVFLIGLIQAPSAYNPYHHPERALKRQQRLLEQMYQRNAITEVEYQIAQREEIRLTPKKVNFKAPHFCEVVLEQLEIADSNVREAEGGALPRPAVVKTTLDYYMQERVAEIVTTRIGELEDYNVTNAAVVVMDNYHGDILAYVGSQDFFDESIAGQVNGITSLRQPGSTLKPFTYQLALEHAYTPATLLPDIQDFPAEARSFIPENYDRKFHGPVRLREALACSYNIPAVRVLEALGVDALYHRLQQYGFTSLQELPSFYGPGLTLGNGEVTLLELTRAYSILARRGKAISERYILEMSPPDEMYSEGRNRDQAREEQLFAPSILYLLTHILADRQAAIPAFGENTPLELPFLTAVKTGTSKDYRDNWTIGFTRDYTIGVWVGNFDGSPMRRVSGITGAAPIYRDIMLALYQYHNPSGLLDHPPAGIIRQQICPVSGKIPTEDCPHSLEELFLQGTMPTEFCDMHKAYWADSRDGLLTEPTSAYAVKKVYLHFPPLYQTWAHEMGFPVRPEGQSGQDVREPGSSPPASRVHDIHIVHPNDGDVYAIDPILRREFQTLQLSAVVASGFSSLAWYVDDELWETVESPFRTAWRLVSGTHRIYAEGQYNGQSLRSSEITIHVVE